MEYELSVWLTEETRQAWWWFFELSRGDADWWNFKRMESWGF